MHNRNHQSNDHAAAERAADDLAAYALGDLGGDQYDAVKARLERLPSLQQQADETRRLADALIAGVAEDLPEASVELREAVERRLADIAAGNGAKKQTGNKSRASFIWWPLAVAASLLIAAFAVSWYDSGFRQREVAADSPQEVASESKQRLLAAKGRGQRMSIMKGERFGFEESDKTSAPASQVRTATGVAILTDGRSQQQRLGANKTGAGRTVQLANGSKPVQLYATPTLVPSRAANSRGASTTWGFSVGKLSAKPSSESSRQVELHYKKRSRDRFDRLAAIDGLLLQEQELKRIGGGGVDDDADQLSEEYATILENAFLPVAGDDAISTISIDVDTASYANSRRFLNNGMLPPPDAVRIEEFINYFKYNYPQPVGDVPFSVNLETADCPWKAGHQLVRVGLKGKDIDAKHRPASNLVFLLDVSGSMKGPAKLPLLKSAMNLLVGELNKDDRVTIVTYAGAAGLALDATPGNKAIEIRQAIDVLSPGGSTNGSAGIQLAYEKAAENYIDGGINRVILATDGDLNVGVTGDNELVDLIKEKASSGVFLTVLGFGTGNLKDTKLEKLADNGNGVYSYIDRLLEARRVLVEQIGGSLVTIAKDVKIQIEFNPAEVKAYRLIGYENRLLAAEDFDDDTTDAGEIGAGHTVTALYELVPADSDEEIPGIEASEGEAKELKYQRRPDQAKKEQQVELTDAAEQGEMLTIALRYKQPDAEQSRRIEHTLKAGSKPLNRASRDMQFAAAVASFGMLLRGSQYSGSATFSAVEEIAGGAIGPDPKGYRNEFLELVRKAEQLQP